MSTTELHQERLKIIQAIESNDSTIAQCKKQSHWHRKHLRLIDEQIEEATKESSSETLQELNGKVQ